MTRFYLRLSILLLPLFTLLAVAMSALGSTHPLHPALRGFVEGCEGVPQPCWYGIVVGMTEEDQAEAILIREGFERGSRQFFWVGNQDKLICQFEMVSSDAIIARIDITFCDGVAIGDIFTLTTFSPIGVYQSMCDGRMTIVREMMSFSGNSFSMYGWIMNIRLSIHSGYQSTTWRGFATSWRYRQLGRLSCLSPNG